MLEKEKYITLNDVGFDKTPILHEIGNEDYKVDEKELQRSIKKNRELLKEENRDELFCMLDRGIDDMEAGRELPLDEAFKMIADLRKTGISKSL